jgi:tetratricopeptide (TPR) repeat protein
MRRPPSRAVAAAGLGLAVGLIAAPALAHDNDAATRRTEIGAYGRDLPQGAAQPTSTEIPDLIPGVGPLTWPGVSANPRAAAYFDQGLNFAWGFNHAEAVRAFRAAQGFDPDCALCFWGEAWALGPNINFPMDAPAHARAVAALEEARRITAGDSGLIAGLVEALSARYSSDPKVERAALDAAYADAMRALHARHPDNAEVAVLTVDALMNLSPWDYWADEGRTPKPVTADMLALLEETLANHPNHIGAIHLYIHTVEASDRPERAAPHAMRLAALSPAVGHLVHMPAHIWYRTGAWRESLDANRAAVAADRAQLARGGASLVVAEGYHPHNIHFVLASALMGGDGTTAVEAAEELAGAVSARAARDVPWTQPIQAAPYVAHARFSTPESVLALPRPAEAGPFLGAHWHYARGVAFARLGRVDEARAEAASIRELAETETILAMNQVGVPGAATLGIAQELVEARAEAAAGDYPMAAARFAKAAEMQEAMPYMEPPFWFDPIRPAQGAALLAAGRVQEAKDVFRAALARQRHDGWAAAGLLAAAERDRDPVVEQEMRGLLARSWFGADLPALDRF